MKLYAEMWDCGDDWCKCTQPRIMEYSGFNFGEAGWVAPKQIDAGPFYSDATPEESLEQEQWLLVAARNHDVVNLADIEARWPTPAAAKPI